MTRIDVAGLMTGVVVFFMFVKWVELTWAMQRQVELLWRHLL